MEDALISEIRELLKNGEVPVRVSNRMLWAAMSEHLKMEDKQWGQMSKNTTDIKWLKRGIGGLFTALLALAAIIFGT